MSCSRMPSGRREGRVQPKQLVLPLTCILKVQPDGLKAWQELQAFKHICCCITQNIAITLSSLSTAEQIARKLSFGTPHAANMPSSSCLWFTCLQTYTANASGRLLLNTVYYGLMRLVICHLLQWWNSKTAFINLHKQTLLMTRQPTCTSSIQPQL